MNNELTNQELTRLTQYSHGAGCGCKISPKILDEILKTNLSSPDNKNLLVGNSSKDDAAVYDLGNGMALISTTDFFMPIVDDAFDFGRIAAANSISDVYAMGGKPLLAIAVLGWPIEKIPVDIAQKVIDGGRTICIEAGIPLAGGHSIDSPEPIFGLAVTGIVNKENLKKNNTAEEADLMFLTKPLGVGILSTAQKRGLLKEEHLQIMINQMTALNKVGEELGKIKGVTAMTDVTGFGLLGHLIEMTDGSGLSAELYYDKIPVADGVKEYISQRIFPDATTRNWSSYSDKIKFEKGVNVMEAFTLLPDPQTNGGLLFSVKENAKDEVMTLLGKSGLKDFIEPNREIYFESGEDDRSKKIVMQIHDKSEIISVLNENADAFNNYIIPLTKEQFEATPNGKWSAGQNLDHLIRAIKPLQLAYGLPKFVLQIMFGKTNRPSKTYDELVTKYKTKLAAGGRASGPFIPPSISFEKKDELIKKYAGQKQKLIAKIEKQSEKDLDVYILPHPLLGKVTLREMLYFTIHHNEHHLELLKSRIQ